MKENMILCDKCRKLRIQFIKGQNLCQICYRGYLEEYSFYDYKVDKSKLKGTKLRVCELLIEEGVDRGLIHKKLGLNKVYVQQIISRYTKRVNENGEERPF